MRKLVEQPSKEREIKLSSLIEEVRLTIEGVNGNVWTFVRALSHSVGIDNLGKKAHERAIKAEPESTANPLSTFGDLADDIAFLKEAVNQVDIALSNVAGRLIPESLEPPRG